MLGMLPLLFLFGSSTAAQKNACPPPPKATNMTVINNSNACDNWEGCNNTIPGDMSTGSCNRTGIVADDWHVCEKLCADDNRCQSWAWGGSPHGGNGGNGMCAWRSDCVWLGNKQSNRVSGFKGPSPPAPYNTDPVAVPTPEQQEWMDFEVGAMLGFNLQTICVPKGPNATSQRCQASSKSEGALYVPTREAVAAWDPSLLDTDEWVKTAVSFGAKYIVLVADHVSTSRHTSSGSITLSSIACLPREKKRPHKM
jgi:hypothetical protein